MERDDAWMERTARAGIVDMAMRGWSGGAEIPMDFMGGYMTVGLSSVLAVMDAPTSLKVMLGSLLPFRRRNVVPDLPRQWWSRPDPIRTPLRYRRPARAHARGMDDGTTCDVRKGQ